MDALLLSLGSAAVDAEARRQDGDLMSSTTEALNDVPTHPLVAANGMCWVEVGQH